MATVHEILLRVTGDSRDGEQALNRIARKVIETGSLRATPEVDLKGATEAFTKIGLMQAALAELDGKHVSAEFTIKVDRARTSLAIMEADLRNVMSRITESRRTGSPLNENELRRAATLLTQIGREGENIGKILSEASGGAGNLNQQFSGMTGALKQINPILQGLVIVLITALIPAMLALGASLISAAGGVAVLANAFLAALGPAVLFTIGIFQRAALIIQVLQARKSAMTAATKKNAQAQLQEASAAEANRNAHNAVRDAIEQRVAAVRRLKQAETDAAAQITAAHQNEVQAATNLKQATQEAFDAMAQSIRDATTALHAYESAQLGIEQSKLNTKKARLELAKLRADMGLTGQKFDKLFNQLTDVSINPAQLRKAIAGQLAAGNVTQDQAIQLQQAHLDLKQAVLGEKEANDRLLQSKADLNKADRTRTQFLREGIRAYQPYVAALNSAKKAESDYQRLLRQGVQNNPSVVDARNSLRDANQRVAEATHDLGAQLKQQKLEAAAASGPLAQYHALLKKLTPVERDFVKFLIQLRHGFADLTRSGTDAFFAGLIVSFNNIKPLLGGMKTLFTQLGTVWAQNILLFSDQLIKPTNVANLRLFGQAAVQLSSILGGRAFRAFFQIMMNLARVAMPLLIQFAQDFAGWLEKAATATGDVSKTAPIINVMVESFRAWLGFIKAVISALGAIVKVAAPFGDEILGWLTDAVNGFSKWANSVKGKNAIKSFFENTLPLVQETLKFIALLVKVFLQGMQLLGPVLAGFLHALNDFLGIVSAILGFINKIADNPWGKAIRFAIGELFGLGAIGKIIGGVWKGLKIVRGALDELGPAAGRVVRTVGGWIGKLGGFFGRIGGFARRAVGSMIGWFARLPKSIGNIFGSIGTAIASTWHTVTGAARHIFNGIIGVFRGIGHAIGRVLGGAIGIVKGVINAAIDLINGVIGVLDKLSVKIPSVNTPLGRIGGGHIGIHIDKIPRLATGGVPTGPTAALIGDVNEAVLPLQGAVLKRVAAAIAGELLSALATAAQVQRGPTAALAGGGTTIHRKATIENLNLITPEGGVTDPRSAVSLLAGEFQRRGV